MSYYSSTLHTRRQAPRGAARFASAPIRLSLRALPKRCGVGRVTASKAWRSARPRRSRHETSRSTFRVLTPLTYASSTTATIACSLRRRGSRNDGKYEGPGPLLRDQQLDLTHPRLPRPRTRALRCVNRRSGATSPSAAPNEGDRLPVCRSCSSAESSASCRTESVGSLGEGKRLLRAVQNGHGRAAFDGHRSGGYERRRSLAAANVQTFKASSGRGSCAVVGRQAPRSAHEPTGRVAAVRDREEERILAAGPCGGVVGCVSVRLKARRAMVFRLQLPAGVDGVDRQRSAP